MSSWGNIVLTVDAPQVRACQRCKHAGSGCKNRAACVEYAIERITRSLAMAQHMDQNEATYAAMEMARRAKRTRRRTR